MEARRLECRAYFLRPTGESWLDAGGFSVAEVELMQPPTRRLLASASGFESKRPVALLGYGALGSTIGELLARMGVGDVHVVDRDTLHPHNLARHSRTSLEVGMPKAEIHRQLELLLSPMDTPTATGARLDLTRASSEQVAAQAGRARLVIDTSASDGVRRVLSSGDVSAGSRSTTVAGSACTRSRALPGTPTYSISTTRSVG